MRQWRYFVLALFVSFLLFLFAVWLPNFSFVREIISSQYFSFPEKISILANSLQAFKTNFRPLGQIILVAVSLLFGLNISLFTFYLKRRMGLQKETGMSLGGIIAGMLGVGCASCGSFILSSLFGAGLSAALVSFLPLRGQEFGIFSIVILVFSNVSVAKKIHKPLICK